MQFTFRPEGAEPRTWSFRPERLMSAEAEAIERQTGWTYQEFGERLIKGSVMARRALLWVLLKREDPPLRYSQVDHPAGSMSLDYERAELEAIRAQLAKDTDLPDGQQDEALRALDDMIAAMPEDAGGPKAPGNVVGLSA